MPVEVDAVDPLGDALYDPVAQVAAVGGQIVPLLGGQSQRFGQAHDARHVLRTRAALPFLAAAHLLGLEWRTTAHVEDAGALRAVELVGRQAEHVDAEVADVQVHQPGGLHGVGVNDDGALAPFGLPFGDAGDLGDRLYGADLVVGQYDADQDGPVGDGSFHVHRVDQPV